ncbi:coiled-coil domain-containing protein [Candidatus Contubernalis alkaliaceticus]|uniref:hypothetical protein n=1 Tax=Candidatus Contubernalis alkaliaceticus TaxID=338645 RepID=UPI001F4C369D|nr:hypothetical protein [Candidatus Contubernalis alkalaceticus]UNC91791.1 hypothetical protein HUE98_06595 [Candidatus Contubernalis alkalaceticus]
MEVDEKYLHLSPSILNENNLRYWFIYPTDKTLNYLFSSDQGSSWSKEKIALHETVQSYAAAIDTQNAIHIIYRDKDQNIMYLKQKDRRWEKKIISREKDGQKAGFFCLLSTENALHLCYLTLDPSGSRWRLIHHIMRGDLWETGKILEEGSGLFHNYAILSAGQQNRVHMIQRRFREGCYVLYYRNLNPTTDLWNNPTIISTKDENHFFPLVLEDEQNDLHSFWINYQDSEYKLIYRKRCSGGWPEGGWGEPKTLGLSKLKSPPLPVVLLNNTGLTAYWKQENTVFYRSSRDKGVNWTTPESYTFKNSYVIRYSQNPRTANREKCQWLLADEYPPGKLIPKIPGTYIQKKEPEITSLSPTQKKDIQNLQPIKEQKLPEPEIDADILEDAFLKLEGYSDHLVKHASNLWKERSQMENILNKRQQQYNTFYKYAGEKVRELNQAISSREKDLDKLKKQLKDTLKGINEQLKNEKIRYKQEKETYDQKILSLTEEIKNYKLQLEKYKDHNTCLENELQNEKNINEKLKEDILKLKETTSKKSSLWSKITKTIYPPKNM